MKKLLLSLALLALSAGLAVWGWQSSAPREVMVDTSGRESPEPGALLENGWLITNNGDATIMDYYQRYRAYLGEPISGFDGTCQTFRLGRLCYNPGNPEGWKLQFDNLGAEDMQVEGYTPKAGKTPAPALRDWIISQREAGVDTLRVIGGTISDPVCDAKTGKCMQWTDKALFIFDQNALSGDQVQRAPLGLWLSHPQTRTVETTSAVPSLASPPFIVAMALAAAGLIVMLAPRGRSARSVPI